MKVNLIGAAISFLAFAIHFNNADAQQRPERDIDYYVANAPFKMPVLIEPRF